MEMFVKRPEFATLNVGFALDEGENLLPAALLGRPFLKVSYTREPTCLPAFLLAEIMHGDYAGFLFSTCHCQSDTDLLPKETEPSSWSSLRFQFHF